MSLAKDRVNALNVLDVRRLTYIPTHFAKMSINSFQIENINSWVYQNLDSRYAIVRSLKLDSSNKLVEVHELGVEDARELTMLSLSCPHLDRL